MSHGVRPLNEKEMCESCALGKQRQKPHKGSTIQGTYPLERLHADICGPFPNDGYDGSRYWALFTCDFTKYIWVFPLKRKSEFCSVFSRLLKIMERPERRCHSLHVDRAGENLSQEMQDLCNDKGITLETTCTEQHEQNGVSEVHHRITMDKLNPTLIESGINHKFWPIILQAVVHIANRSPRKSLQTTPYEAWYGEKPDLSHLRIIGTDGWALFPASKIKKMQPKAYKCKLLGYQGTTNYIVLSEDEKIMVTNNVTFDEKRGRTIDSEEKDTQKQKRVRFLMNQTKIILPNADLSREPSYPKPRVEPSPREIIEDLSDTIEEATPDTTEQSISCTDSESVRDEIIVEPTPKYPMLRVSERQNKGTPPSRYAMLGTSSPESLIRDHEPQFALFCHQLAQNANLAAPKPDPKTYREAISGYEKSEWWNGMKSEITSIEENKTFRLVTLPPGKHALRGKWVYKRKYDLKGIIARWKARFVVRGFEQREGFDYTETFASVVKPMSYKLIFAIAAALDLELEQMDVQTAFLYGDVSEEVYVEQPEGFNDGTGRVWRLQKALYGLKQSPRIWYQTLSDFLKSLGFTPLVSDMGIFIDGNLYIAVYVDDLLIAGPDKVEIQQLKEQLSTRFKMTDLGPCSQYLGMEITRDRDSKTLRLGQQAYILKVLKDFGMMEAKPVTTPVSPGKYDTAPDGYSASPQLKTWYARAIGSLMYIMLGTRPDIAFAVSLFSRYLGNPSLQHETGVKRIFRYLKGTAHLVLTFKGDLRDPMGYTDADWAGDIPTRRSTSGYIFNVGSGCISWQAKRQPVVATSSCEAEFRGQAQATKEALWLRNLFTELLLNDRETLSATIIYGDNQGAIAMSKNPESHSRMKHIDIQQHFVRERVESGEVAIEYVPTEKQVADGLTKPLSRDKFTKFREALGLYEP
jgi:hypothetical protein